MSSASQLIEQAKHALQMNDTQTAQQLLARAVGNEPTNEHAWLWLSAALTDSAERRYCLEHVLRLAPEQPMAKRAVAALPPGNATEPSIIASRSASQHASLHPLVMSQATPSIPALHMGTSDGNVSAMHTLIVQSDTTTKALVIAGGLLFVLLLYVFGSAFFGNRSEHIKTFANVTPVGVSSIQTNPITDTNTVVALQVDDDTPTPAAQPTGEEPLLDTPTPQSDNTSTPENISTIEPTPDNTSTPQSNDTPTPTFGTNALPNGLLGYINNGGNMRSSPAIGDNVTWQVCPGDQIIINEMQPGWVKFTTYKLSFDCHKQRVPINTEGWVSSSIITEISFRPDDTYPVLPEKLTPAVVEFVAQENNNIIGVSIRGIAVNIRIIGIDMPQGNECYASQAAKQLHTYLDGQFVLLEQDKMQGSTDEERNQLRHVWLPNGQLLALELISQGIGNQYNTHNKTHNYQQQFEHAEQQARDDSRGLWAASTCNGQRNP